MTIVTLVVVLLLSSGDILTAKVKYDSTVACEHSKEQLLTAISNLNAVGVENTDIYCSIHKLGKIKI